jgi:hypothetical protein
MNRKVGFCLIPFRNIHNMKPVKSYKLEAPAVMLLSLPAQS